MKKKILSAILAVVMAVTVTGFTLPAKTAYASTEATVEAANTLKITDVKADKYGDPQNEYPGNAKVGDRINISCKAEGGEGYIKYTYSIVPRYGQYIPSIYNASAPDGKFVWTPTDAQLYEIEVTATDAAGNTAYTILHYDIAEAKNLTVNLTGDYLTHPDKSVQGYAVIGQDINFKATSDMQTDYHAKYTYTIRGVGNGTTKTVTTTDGNYTWTPTTEDFYVVTVDAEDMFGNIGSKTVNYQVSHPLTVDSYVANREVGPTLEVYEGSPIDSKASVSGGAVAGYTYTFDVIPCDGTNAERQTVTKTTPNYSFMPSSKGTYLMKVTVKDEQGSSVVAVKQLIVK